MDSLEWNGSMLFFIFYSLVNKWKITSYLFISIHYFTSILHRYANTIECLKQYLIVSRALNTLLAFYSSSVRGRMNLICLPSRVRDHPCRPLGTAD